MATPPLASTKDKPSDFSGLSAGQLAGHLSQDKVVSVNVRGTIFTTLKTTLTRHPDSMLATLLESELTARVDGVPFIDRNPSIFANVLHCLQYSDVKAGLSQSELIELWHETDYYGLTVCRENVEFELQTHPWHHTSLGIEPSNYRPFYYPKKAIFVHPTFNENYRPRCFGTDSLLYPMGGTPLPPVFKIEFPSCPKDEYRSAMYRVYSGYNIITSTGKTMPGLTSYMHPGSSGTPLEARFFESSMREIKYKNVFFVINEGRDKSYRVVDLLRIEQMILDKWHYYWTRTDFPDFDGNTVVLKEASALTRDLDSRPKPRVAVAPGYATPPPGLAESESSMNDSDSDSNPQVEFFGGKFHQRAGPAPAADPE